MNDWRPFVYGGLASMTAEIGTFPLDLTKTRLQIQGQKLDKSLTTLKYRGMSHALSSIAKEEGLKGLYSGIAPALLRQATYGTLKIGLYYSLKQALLKDPKDETLAFNVALGVIAGSVGSAIANPTDVLKVRMQADSKAVQLGMGQAFKQIYRQEGVAGLWRGVFPTGQRAAVVAGVELPIYDICKKHIISSGYLSEGVFTHFIASFIAGFAGAVASNPIDVVKSRLMNQKKIKASVVVEGAHSAQPIIYKSAWDCVVQTVKTEGPMALYKGFIPTWFRLGPWNVLFFITYEQLKKLY